MKKLIAVLFVVSMVSTPCLAQVEPDSNFSIDGTLWSTGQIETPNWKGTIYIGFYDGDIYVSPFYGWYDLFHIGLRHSYGDLGVASYFFMIGPPPWGDPNCIWGVIGLLSPLGFGIVTEIGNCVIPSLPPLPFLLPTSCLVVYKIEDNWDPSGWEGGY